MAEVKGPCRFLYIEVKEKDARGTLGVLYGWKSRREMYASQGATEGRVFCTLLGYESCEACKTNNPDCGMYEPLDTTIFT